VCPTRASGSGVRSVQAPVSGLQVSTAVSACPSPLRPPMARTSPLASTTMRKSARGRRREPVAVHCPVSGSQTSAAPVGEPAAYPPARSTRPSGRAAAAWAQRSLASVQARVNVSAAAS